MSESISQNAVEFDVKVSNHDALTKLTSEMNKLKGIDTGIDDPFKNIKQSAQKATSDVSKMTSGVKNNSNALNDGANKASSFTAKLKEIKKISFEKLKSGAGAFAAKLKEAANVSFEKLKSSLKSVQGLLGSGFKKAAGLAVKGTAAAAAGVGALAAQSVNAYADTEQLIGGVETLFGAGGAKSVEEYAQNVGKSVSEVQKKYNQLANSEATVLNNAKDSFKTTGLSANDYMETVTSFSASLVSSLKGNTEKAAALSNQALVDMSDNANKMGTDMASIQNAYQGFAKQNYTMLDNLKLGYGGTQEEMKRLLKDASALKKAQGQNVKYSINKFSDIIEAIHTVQENMGITGTTMKEAESTISGSLNMLKASWKDTLSSLVSGDGDFDRCIDNLIYSAGKFGENVIPAIEKALAGTGSMVLGAGLLVAAAGVAAFAASALIAVASVTVLTGIMGVLIALIVVFAVSALALSAAFLILGTATPKFADAVGLLPGAFGAMLVPAAALLAVIAPLTVEFAALALALGVVYPAMSGMASSITIMSVMLPMLLSGMSDAPKIFESMLSPTEQLLAVASPLAAAFTVLASAAAMLGSAITTTANGIITVLSAMQLLPAIMAAVFSSIEKVVKTSCGKLVTISRNCTNNIKSVFSSMNLSSAGQNAMQGLINGMEAKRPAVVSKARNIANSVSRTINDALQIHSPSRVTTESGEFTTLGLINGMENKLPALNAASKKVATTAAISINDELMAYSSDDGGSSINTIYGGDTTVAPVFNLTINGMTSDSERQTARKVRGWVQDEFENILNSMNRRNTRTQYI